MPPKTDKQNKVTGQGSSNYMSFQAVHDKDNVNVTAPNVFVKGRCRQCDSDAEAETVSCLFCKEIFHLSNCFHEDALNCVAPSSISTFVNAVNKKAGFAKRSGNFKFICDPCLTQFEVNQTSSTNDKVQALDNRVTKLYNELSQGIGQIKDLLNSSFDPKKACDDSTGYNDCAREPSCTAGNVWSDKDRVRSLLVVDKNVTLDAKAIEKTAINNGIPIDKCNIHDTKTGNSVFILPSQKARDKLQEKIKELHPTASNDSFRTPQPRLPTISIVGVPSELDKDGITATIMAQNEWIKNLCGSEEINNFKVLTIKNLRNNASVSQAIVCVSDSVRQAIATRNNRVFIGMRSCTVYDQWYVKRCNKCQDFGHYAKQCTQGSTVYCGYCAADDHQTIDCTHKSNPDKLCCVNCKNAGNEHANTHPAYSQSCPVYVARKDSLKASILSRSKN